MDQKIYEEDHGGQIPYDDRRAKYMDAFIRYKLAVKEYQPMLKPITSGLVPRG